MWPWKNLLESLCGRTLSGILQRDPIGSGGIFMWQIFQWDLVKVPKEGYLGSYMGNGRLTWMFWWDLVGFTWALQDLLVDCLGV